ncbi:MULTISPECIES: glycosyltransferase family 2 protein [Marinovum]|uniref:glycosyltransferase family 2 protein n=1 Tax=Marinovum TaxID=367771 RepID=UPI00237A2123|nr:MULTISPECIES: glycosyltransferase [Marinovum]MDD9740566.1 glycosyltransferase [Marinovum sp. SP66]
MRPVSVIIVSHGREAALKRCLKALRQLLYPTFEVVVVADRPTLAALQGLPQAMGIKTAPCDAQNISLARNIGLGLAAGEVVAFIDDDAVPEPTWLTHLAAVFDDAEVAAAGGYVRGRNGISWQWRGAWVDGCGVRHALPLEGERPTVLHPGPGRAVKTEGTNMAFRREVIAGIGGFDPAFRFFLDETDLNLRLARAGLATALVPLAQVHHGFAASARRRADRVPRDLFEIGASHAAFLLRHCPDAKRGGAQARFAGEQRRRLLRHMVAGRLEPRDVRHLLARLEAGFAAGAARAPGALPALPHASEPFAPLPPRPALRPKLTCGRWWHRARLRRQAAHDAAAGHVSTALIFSLTTAYCHVRFTPAGYWEHSGGQFGKSERDEPLFTLRRLRRKCDAEIARIRRERGLTGES